MKKVPSTLEETRDVSNILWSEYRHFEGLLSSTDKMSYKLLAVFLVVSTWFVYMQGRGVITDYRIGVLWIGIGLLACHANLLWLGLMYEKSFSACFSKMIRFKKMKLETPYTEIDITRSALGTKILFRSLPIFLAYASTTTAVISLSTEVIAKIRYH